MFPEHGLVFNFNDYNIASAYFKKLIKITSILVMFCILLYFPSIDEISADHVVGEDVIHKNYFEIIMKSSPPGLDLEAAKAAPIDYQRNAARIQRPVATPQLAPRRPKPTYEPSET